MLLALPGVKGQRVTDRIRRVYSIAGLIIATKSASGCRTNIHFVKFFCCCNSQRMSVGVQRWVGSLCLSAPARAKRCRIAVPSDLPGGGGALRSRCMLTLPFTVYSHQRKGGCSSPQSTPLATPLLWLLIASPATAFGAYCSLYKMASPNRLGLALDILIRHWRLPPIHLLSLVEPRLL